MVQLEKTIAQLRICSGMLAEVDSWDMFFPVVLATRQVLEDILPKPYIDTPAPPLPPAEIFALADKLNKLELCKISVSEFLYNTLDPFIEKLDKAVYSALSVVNFKASLASLLHSLAVRETVRDEAVPCKTQAQHDVENSIASLWVAFSALPEDEKTYLLSLLPTTAAE